MSSLPYRRDIDGLRALAILSVVFYHLGLGGFTGGYVGVDVFLVISGYLITSIIRRDRQAGRFSFVDFWARRARRILPALFVMMAVSLAAGWFLMEPRDYEQLGRAVRYQTMFASNILFWKQDGYFDAASEFKPLLHTWSLSVEEQFYILFPLLLAAISGRLLRWRLAILLAVLALSLAASVWAVNQRPGSAFFLLPMRAWELLAGAALALLPGGSRGHSQWSLQLAATLGIAAILLPVFFYDSDTPFPGLAALPAVLGTALLIWANGTGDTWVRRLLGWQPLVWFGLISYSLYLWHWPLYVFVQYHALETLGLPARLGLLAASIGLAALSLYYVEAPFRERKLFAGRRQMLGAALCSLLLLGVVGQLVRHYDGVPSRLSEEALRYAKASKWRDGQTDCMFDKKALSQESICRFPAELAAERPLLVSWGDSHSAALSPLLRELAASRRLPIWQASLAGCPPLLGMLEKDTCLRFNQQMLEFVEQQRPGGVILAGRWDMYIYGDSQDGTRNILREPDDTPDSSIAEALLRQRLSGMIERLNAADVHVWLVKDVPLLPFKAPARLVRLSLSGEDVGRARFPFAEHTARVAYVNALFDALAEGNPRVSVIDPSSVLCDGLDCFAERDGWSLYMDNNHLSTQGAHELGPLFEPMLQSLDDSRIASQQ